MTKVCEFCGKRFEAIRPTKRFCSKSCVNRHLRTGCATIEEARKRPRVTFEIVCVFCGKKFTAKNLARALKKENDAMRLAMVRAGVSVRVEVGQERSER